MQTVIFDCSKRDYKKEYAEYLLSPHWLNFSHLVYKKYPVCVYCGSPGKRNLHHLTYERRGHEEEDDVVRLCQFCHYELHDGKITVADVLRLRSLFTAS